MRNLVLGLMAAAASTASSATVTLTFNSATGVLPSSKVYSSGPLSVTATGFQSGLLTPLFGKNDAGNEKGIGIASDPSGQHEIYYNTAHPAANFIQLDVHNLFGLVTAASFFTGSTTNHEQWKVYGSGTNGVLGTLLSTGQDEGTHPLNSFGEFAYYDFVSGGTIDDGAPSTGNFLLRGVTLTTAVPEPATWAMMLVGFGAVGFALRKRPNVRATINLA